MLLSYEHKNGVTIGSHTARLLLSRVSIVLAQYVLPSKAGLLRIVQHGRRWRALLDERELGRHETAERALAALREACPRARIPASFAQWRPLPVPTWSYSGPPRRLRAG
ncbi:hypothetical protein ACFPPA_07185 [Rhodanobacter ginsengisoli]|uniref:Uncharacterized protein n=1 Tax=Rhodanobacter ginsengisoli TaxID=418646 RepID=A0ABW0QL55_9GAMM